MARVGELRGQLDADARRRAGDESGGRGGGGRQGHGLNRRSRRRGRAYPGPVPTPGRSSWWGPGPPGWRPPWRRRRGGRRRRPRERLGLWAAPRPCRAVWCGCRRTAAGQRGTGSSDSSEDAADALAVSAGSVGQDDVDLELVRAFVSDTRRVADEIEKRTPIEWEVLEHWPDYRGELPGAPSGGGRCGHGPLALARRHRGPRPARPRPADAGARHRRASRAMPLDTDALDTDAPANDGVVLRGHVRGRALVGGLLAGLVDAGVEVRTGRTRRRAWSCEGEAVVGVRRRRQRRRAGAVVLATGGFQHDAALVGALPGRAAGRRHGRRGVWRRRPAHGASSSDAELGNMDEGWWMPAMHVPGRRARRRDALPAAARRAGPARGDHGGPHRAALRRRGPELRRRGPGHARRAAAIGPGARVTRPRRAGWCSTPPTGAATRWARSSPATPDPAGWRRGRRSRRAWPARIGVSRRAHWAPR